jgi:hypothetical protein
MAFIHDLVFTDTFCLVWSCIAQNYRYYPWLWGDDVGWGLHGTLCLMLVVS